MVLVKMFCNITSLNPRKPNKSKTCHFRHLLVIRETKVTQDTIKPADVHLSRLASPKLQLHSINRLTSPLYPRRFRAILFYCKKKVSQTLYTITHTRDWLHFIVKKIVFPLFFLCFCQFGQTNSKWNQFVKLS